MQQEKNIFDQINSEVLSLLFKIGFLILAGIYFLFSLIVVRQVNLMSETVITEGAPILKIIALLHALLALGVIVLFILIL